MVIYKINFPNGKVYIGVTKNLKRRISQHLWACKRDVKKKHYPVYKAMLEYNTTFENFEVVETCYDYQTLLNREVFWIDFYKSYINREYSNGYNVTLGGEGSLGYSPSEDTRLKLSKAGKGVKRSESFKQKVSERQLGKIVSPATRLKISKSLKGRVKTQEEKQGFLNYLANNPHPCKGRILSKETRDKISKALTGKIHSEEARLNMSLSKIGKKHSDETKKKLSIIKKGVPAKPSQLKGLKEYLANNPHPCKGRRLSEKQKKNLSIKLTGKSRNVSTIRKSRDTRVRTSLIKYSLTPERVVYIKSLLVKGVSLDDIVRECLVDKVIIKKINI